MPTFFHVSTQGLAAGQVLQPGNWGRQCRQFGMPGAPNIGLGSNAVNLSWEIALETARLLCAADSPSRLDCVFACVGFQDALNFRNRYRVGGGVYEVTCPDSTLWHAGNFDAISNAPANIAWVDYMTAQAIQYWRGPPGTITETLIGSAVTAGRKLA